MFRMRRCSPTFLKLTTICDVSHVISFTRPSSPLFFSRGGARRGRPGYEASQGIHGPAPMPTPGQLAQSSALGQSTLRQSTPHAQQTTQHLSTACTQHPMRAHSHAQTTVSTALHSAPHAGTLTCPNNSEHSIALSTSCRHTHMPKQQ